MIRQLILGVALATALVAQTSQAADGVLNVVLVHGAWADGSSWSKVIALLEKAGLHAVAVQNPLTSFDDDVAATKRAIALQDGPVILVGHSWGGVVITEAGSDPKVAGLVYVAAFAPDVGVPVGDLGKGFPEPPGARRTASRRAGIPHDDDEGYDGEFRAGSPGGTEKDHCRYAGCDEQLGVRRQGQQRRLERQTELVCRRRQ